MRRCCELREVDLAGTRKLTLSSQVLLGLLFGFLGLFLATPLTVVIYVLVRELYVKDVLGGHEPERCE